MAVNKKQQKKQDKDTYRRKYRNLRELRWWFAGLLAICIALTAWSVVERNNENEALLALAAGDEYRNTTVITGGATEVSLMAMSYYFYDAYYNIMESDSFLTDYRTYGLDPEKPLKELEYTSLRTWFDELLTQTYEGIDQVVRYAELARQEGLTLDAEDEKAVEDKINAIAEKAAAADTTLANYIDMRYAPGMTVEDLRSAIRLYTLGEKQYTLSMDYMLECTDAEIDAYYEANVSTLITADYVFYKFYAATRAELEAKAATFAACADEYEFLDLLEKDIRAQGASDSDVSNYREQSIRRIDHTENDALDAWAFETNKGRGDTFVEYEENACTVYWLIRPGEKITTPSANARSILISGGAFETPADAEKKAKEIYDMAVADGTEEYFAELAKEHSYDETTAGYGGEYADIVPGDVVLEYEEWVFEEGRKYGDIGMVENDGNYHIIFFLRTGEPCWKVTAKNAMIDKRIENFTTKLEADILLIKDEITVTQKVPDDLATDRDRDYVAVEKDGALVYELKFKLFSLVSVMFLLSLISAAFTAWAFIETARLNKKYNYKA